MIISKPGQTVGGGMGQAGHLCEHSHIGFIGHDPRHWRRIVFPFLAKGLARGEQCLYLTSIHPPKVITALLAQEGVDVEKARAHGQFSIKDAAQIHMPQGWFDLEHVIRQHEQSAGTARQEGFAGLRIVSDMAWASYAPIGWEHLEEYENRVGAELCFCHSLKLMCFYDDMMFDPTVISSVERTHAVLIDNLGSFRVGPPDLGGPSAGPLDMGTRRGGWPKEFPRWLRPPRHQQPQPRL